MTALHPDHHSQRIAVLNRLQAGICTNVELQTPEIGGMNLTARISEIRKSGHLVTCLPPLVGRQWRYRYDGLQSVTEIRQEHFDGWMHSPNFSMREVKHGR